MSKRTSRFRAWMDRIAAARPNGWVAKFRRWNGGPLSTEEMEIMEKLAQDVAKKARKK